MWLLLLVVRTTRWACSAAGSAPEWHSGGHRFDPGQVHNPPSSNGGALKTPAVPRSHRTHELPSQRVASLMRVPAAWHLSPTQVPRIHLSLDGDGGVALPGPQTATSSRCGRA